MLSTREIKWINSLKNKKYRLKHKAYLAEGPRLINELILNGQKALKIFTTGDIEITGQHDEQVLVKVSEKELKRISLMVQPNGMLAVFQLSEDTGNEENQGPILHPSGEWGFALDFIQDPGNLGTIIRSLAWLGVDRLYCSSDSVDMYNPKVVQASMGGIGRMKLCYVNLSEFLKLQSVPVYAAEMGGTPINNEIPKPGIIVFGNEGRGLSDEVRNICQSSVGIPKAGGGESLNVAVSVAILAAWITLQ